MKDSFGRVVESLRISVTDRCNFRCRYCMPEEGMVWLKHGDLLTYEEIVRLAGIFTSLGVTKFRLTGGEPLMRKEVPVLVAGIRKVPGVRDIALTTNGYFLEEHAAALAAAGLDRLNVSLDSLNPSTFTAMARRDFFDKVWRGLDVAKSLPIRPIKLNVVLIRGQNDNEIEKFALLARTGPFIVRFIEFMPIGADDGWTADKVISTAEVIERIRHLGLNLVPSGTETNQAAERYTFSDGVGEVGFISSVSNPFCESCNRVRITSDGHFRTCLFSHHETDLKQLLRNGASDDEVRGVITKAVWEKEKGHLINQPGFVRPERTMSQIGG
jgi:GTP 3',8-cyclase